MRHPAFRRGCQIVAVALLALAALISTSTTLLQG